MSNKILEKAIADEGFCCLFEYLTLSREWGHSEEAMARQMGVSEGTIRYHYRLFAEKKRTHRCRAGAECNRATDCPPQPEGGEGGPPPVPF